ncbi:ABC transporter ATP-binding protein [Sphingomonas sp. BK235]|uniref:ABC transporter ATP-binding protein n=1 Tax=Sphingomonas sp. BK235 TaxID=2512131 RepID=UPI0010518113|nr:ABC transporter ATP-binding protein [Sphingomonas sp. BK235]TCP36842.1 iron complex transport system ATP-binding protein [Sphingomonas sp. BK235]
MSVLAASDLSLTLGDRRVLDAVTVAFAPGRVTALLGPNGAGKSSLLACLSALRMPDAGAATLDAVDVRAVTPSARARRIGFLPQQAEVHWSIDVATLVALGRLPWRGRGGDGEADRAAVRRALAATATTALADRRVDQLSGGERARVLLARVLAGDPEWLLADEPLASLDPAHQLDIGARLRAVAAGGRGVVLVVHDLNLAARLADEVVLLRDGRIVAAGETATVLTAETIATTYGVAVDEGVTSRGDRFFVPIAR